jgi:hypothetical protein
LQLPVGQGRQLFALHQICVHSVTRPSHPATAAATKSGLQKI